jgi:hypothetical protein
MFSVLLLMPCQRRQSVAEVLKPLVDMLATQAKAGAPTPAEALWTKSAQPIVRNATRASPGHWCVCVADCNSSRPLP